MLTVIHYGVLGYEAKPALECEADSKHGNISSLNSIYDTSRKFSKNLRYKTRGIIPSFFRSRPQSGELFSSLLCTNSKMYQLY